MDSMFEELLELMNDHQNMNLDKNQQDMNVDKEDERWTSERFKTKY